MSLQHVQRFRKVLNHTNIQGIFVNLQRPAITCASTIAKKLLTILEKFSTVPRNTSTTARKNRHPREEKKHRPRLCVCQARNALTPKPKREEGRTSDRRNACVKGSEMCPSLGPCSVCVQIGSPKCSPNVRFYKRENGSRKRVNLLKRGRQSLLTQNCHRAAHGERPCRVACQINSILFIHTPQASTKDSPDLPFCRIDDHEHGAHIQTDKETTKPKQDTRRTERSQTENKTGHTRNTTDTRDKGNWDKTTETEAASVEVRGVCAGGAGASLVRCVASHTTQTQRPPRHPTHPRLTTPPLHHTRAGPIARPNPVEHDKARCHA